MDRSLNSSLRGASYSPLGRQNISSRRSMAPTPFKNSSRFSTSGMSAQSTQVILKSQGNYVERFGQNLPVLITEALTFAERNTVVSARISECGFAWVVCGRRLLVWQYRHVETSSTSSARKTSSATSQCYELQLPQSGLAHRAELVSVFLQPGSQHHMASCIAVSPEGVMRYWAAVAHESVYSELSVDLQGQECDSITSVDGLGCILATTTCTVVLVQPQLNAGGRPNITTKTLKMPSGWLGGISRKMSSLIFGPISSEQSAETRLVRVLSVPNVERENSYTVYVLAGHSLQKWKLSTNSGKEPEQLIFVAELNRLVQEGFQATVWENHSGDRLATSMIDCQTWLLDIQPDVDSSVIILAAAVNLTISPQIHYALIKLATKSNMPPVKYTEFNVIHKLNGFYREENPTEGLSFRFLLCNSTAYLYNSKSITVVVKGHEEMPDTLEFSSPHDFLLGGSVCINTPVFFSRNHGLVSVSFTSTNHDLSTTNLESSFMLNETNFNENYNNVGNLTLYNLDADEISNAHKDSLSQLKAAFIFHVKNQTNACQEILNELFPSNQKGVENWEVVDGILDKIVVAQGEELLNDVPASDPRWTGQGDIGIGSSHSMQIPRLLEDKQIAFNLFTKFLKENGLWMRLSAITKRGTVLMTTHVLGELAEQVVAAISLKSLPTTDVLQNAIRRVIDNEGKQLENGLTYFDVFYCKVTQTYRGFHELVEYCEELVNSDMDPTVVAQKICETNQILLSVLKDVMHFRQQTAESYSSNTTVEAAEYLPWTAAPGKQGLYDSLMAQQMLTYKYGVKVTSDRVLCNTLYDQLVFIIDIILDGRKCHLESVKDTDREDIFFKQYQTDRKKLIKPLLDDKEWERAILLAEKYLDFSTLIMICENTNNQARLDEYVDRFANENFSEYLYNWYLQENKQGKLLDKCRTNTKGKTVKKLTGFLSEHPSLSWMQNIFDGKFEKASTTLRNLAEEEHESVTRKKTMLSLAKLSKLVTNNTNLQFNPIIQEINQNLDVISYQEDVPDYVLEQFGYDTLRPRVIATKELVHLFVCPEYRDASEIDFKKALDLTEFIKDRELRNDLRLRVWKNAILRDNWNTAVTNLDSPMEVLQNKLFFKLAELAINLGSEPSNLLPPLDALVEDEELSHLQENKSFQYLLKYAYEHIHHQTSC